VLPQAERPALSKRSVLLLAGLSAINAGLLLAGGARSQQSAAVAASQRPSPPSNRASTSSAPRSAPNPAWSAHPCEQQLANETRQLSILERFAAQHLPLAVRFDRESRPSPALSAEVAEVLLRLGAPADAAPECRGSLCRIDVPAAVGRSFREDPWVREHVVASGGSLEGANLILFIQTRDRRSDGAGFLMETWQAFISTGLPGRCWRSTTSTARLKVTLELVDEESQPTGPPRLTAHYYGPGLGDDVIRCISEGLDHHLAATSVAETLLPARLSRQLPEDL
jgi:hypothetical protein